jgi:hypothetical protein
MKIFLFHILVVYVKVIVRVEANVSKHKFWQYMMRMGELVVLPFDPPFC